MMIESSKWMMVAASIPIGLVIGSFLNVVAVRLPLGESIITPRSRCVHCKHTLTWFDNIPILSFLFLKGRCRYCQSTISIRYPIIEALTALLFATAVLCKQTPPLELILRDWPFLALLLSIVFIDLEYRVIPDELSLGGLAWGLATFWLATEFSFFQIFGGAALGFGLFYSLAWLYYKLRGQMGLGGGDIKLLAMLGAYIGPMGVLMTIGISSIFGSIVGLVWAMNTNRKGVMQFAIPYGPFLAVGALFDYFLGDVVWYLYTKQM
jgi:leader peptidase (prepilin peptidase)/N-methyltransferase